MNGLPLSQSEQMRISFEKDAVVNKLYWDKKKEKERENETPEEKKRREDEEKKEEYKQQLLHEGRVRDRQEPAKNASAKAEITNTTVRETNARSNPNNTYTYPPEVTYQSDRKSIFFNRDKDYINIDTGDVYNIVVGRNSIIDKRILPYATPGNEVDTINTKYGLELKEIGTPGPIDFSLEYYSDPSDHFERENLAEKKVGNKYRVIANLIGEEYMFYTADRSDKRAFNTRYIGTKVDAGENGNKLKNMVESNGESRAAVAAAREEKAVAAEAVAQEEARKEEAAYTSIVEKSKANPGNSLLFRGHGFKNLAQEGGSLKKYKKKTKKSKKQIKRKRTRKQKHYRNKK
jgi:hypothetical protein